MKKIIVLTVVLCFLASNSVQASPILVSEGNSSLMDYKTFTVISSRMPDTPEFLREIYVLQNLSFHLKREGYEYVDSMEEADLVVTALIFDDVRQRYIPPSAYSTTTYSADTSSNISGMAFGTGSFINFNATSNSDTTGTATTTTTVSGGYYVPEYVIGVIVSIYDTNTQNLIWSGLGYSTVSRKDLLSYVDGIIYNLVKDKMITPALVRNERKKHRFSRREIFTQEFLKPLDLDRQYYRPTTNGGNISGLDYVVQVQLENQRLAIIISGTNESEIPIEFDPSHIKVTVEGKTCYVMSKREVMDAAFKLGERNVKDARSTSERFGLIGALFEPFADLVGASPSAMEEKRGKAIRFLNDRYIEKVTLEPGAIFSGTFDVVMPFYLVGGEEVAVSLSVGGETQTVKFTYEKGWRTSKEEYRELKRLAR
ncbi:MAG: hypothetical protein WCV56_01205 [Candidatus Omnitrophota bacterium]